MGTEGDLTWVANTQYNAQTINCAPKACMILLTDATPEHSIEVYLGRVVTDVGINHFA